MRKFHVIDLMLNVYGNHLRSCWDGQFLVTLFMGKPPGGSLPVLSAHFSPVTDNLLFLNQRKREIVFPRKNVPGSRIDRTGHATDRDTALGPTFKGIEFQVIKTYSLFMCFA